jgi:hypothetical protein
MAREDGGYHWEDWHEAEVVCRISDLCCAIYGTDNADVELQQPDVTLSH